MSARIRQDQEPQSSSADTPVKTVEERNAELEEQLLRLRADSENFRKRLKKDTELKLKFASESLIKDLLDSIDAFEQAWFVIGSQESEMKGITAGLLQIGVKLFNTLKLHGVEQIDIQLGVTKFDPLLHEIIDTVPHESPDQTILHVARSGYRLYDKVIRASQVIVSKGTLS